MLSKRLIVCLDVRDGKVTKGVQFKGNVEVGEPVEMAEEYYHQGVDEVVFYDITASAEGRPIDIEMVREVARRIFIPFSVGGGLRNLLTLLAFALALIYLQWFLGAEGLRGCRYLLRDLPTGRP